MPKTAEQRLPSLGLLSELTDRHVLEQLLAAEGLTRAQLAQQTGISKPTISESVRRLVDADVVVDSGERTSGRGPAGALYRIRDDVGSGLAVSVGPDGVLVEVVDVRGRPVHSSRRPVAVPVSAAALEPLLSEDLDRAVSAAHGPVLAAAVSLAGPVDQPSGRLIHLPNSPFLTDELDARRLLHAHLPTGIEVEIDNDVNWAAVAEHSQGHARDLDDYFFCYLGAGLGGAITVGGELLRGHRGFAGEIAHVRTYGPGGRTLRLVECFEAWDLLQPHTDAIDVVRVTSVVAGQTAADRRLRTAISRSVATALASIVALLNPGGIVLGGPWGGEPAFVSLVRAEMRQLIAVELEIRPAAIGPEAPLVGARVSTLDRARQILTGRRS